MKILKTLTYVFFSLFLVLVITNCITNGAKEHYANADAQIKLTAFMIAFLVLGTISGIITGISGLIKFFKNN
ncbi:MAG TPA: hypothetical protein VK172_14860 [Lentimicrobium sp.]|nr:hypothetical protein [Bacteroidales bacterium]HLO92443.1 hypothetical protein [Lentimicrobium sp.]